MGGIMIGGSGSIFWLEHFQKKTSNLLQVINSPQATQLIYHKITQIYRGHTRGVFSLAWSHSGKYIVSTGLDQTVQVWEPYNIHNQPLFIGSLFATGESVTWSPNDQYIATVGDSPGNFLHIWDWQAQKSVFNAPLPRQLRSVAWSLDSKYLAFAGTDNTVQILDVTNIKHVHSIFTYIGHTQPINAIAWSPDSQYIASGSKDTTVQVWKAVDGRIISTYREHMAQLLSVSWSPDGKNLATGDITGAMHVWNAPSGQKSLWISKFQGLQGHTGVRAISWSFDSNYLVCGSWNKTVVVFTRDGQFFPPFENHKGALGSVSWSPHINLIASASSDDIDPTVQIWQAF